MKKYLSISKGIVLENMSFSFHFILTFMGNILYITLIYFLWKAIYHNTPGKINGMSFNDTFLYLTLATSIFSLLMTWTDWGMSRMMLSGNIIIQFVRPTDFQLYILFQSLGDVINNIFTIFLPSFILIIIAFKASVLLGPNLLFFVIAIALAFLINFNIDYIIGLLSFYTESIWGISTTKEVIVLLLSGSVIPLPFFPEVLRRVVEFLPFQAIYNIPLEILIKKNISLEKYCQYLGVQIIWVVILFGLSRMFFRQASKIITVNGG